MMIPTKYQHRLQKTIRKYFPKNKVFIFGSSIQYEDFWDIDVGILDKVDKTKFQQLIEDFEQSTFPYLVDLKDFNTVDKDFADSVLNHQKIKWI